MHFKRIYNCVICVYSEQLQTFNKPIGPAFFQIINMNDLESLLDL